MLYRRVAIIAYSAFLAGNLIKRAKQRLKILDWHKTIVKRFHCFPRRRKTDSGLLFFLKTCIFISLTNYRIA